ncbi:hypothetical protein NA610_22980, partial [Salmonella sp. NW387]|uniref:hypothetical protein n=1 Tax=Salmonella sp. NW387 TaxID=2947947 RepID=UPI003F4237A8
MRWGQLPGSNLHRVLAGGGPRKHGGPAERLPVHGKHGVSCGGGNSRHHERFLGRQAQDKCDREQPWKPRPCT